MTQEERDELQASIDAYEKEGAHVVGKMILVGALDAKLPEVPDAFGVEGGAMAALLGGVLQILSKNRDIGRFHVVVVDGYENHDPAEHPEACLHVPTELLNDVLTRRAAKWFGTAAMKKGDR